MKNISKLIAAAALIAAVLLSLTSCAGNGGMAVTKTVNPVTSSADSSKEAAWFSDAVCAAYGISDLDVSEWEGKKFFYGGAPYDVIGAGSAEAAETVAETTETAETETETTAEEKEPAQAAAERGVYAVGIADVTEEEYYDLVLALYNDCVLPQGGALGFSYDLGIDGIQTVTSLKKIGITREGLSDENNLLVYKTEDGCVRSISMDYYQRKNGNVAAGSMIIVLGSESLKGYDSLEIK